MPSTLSSKPLNIVMAASEAVPFAKTGGLADVVGALPTALTRLGHRVTLILPGYPSLLDIRQSRSPLEQFSIPIAGKSVVASLEEKTLPSTDGNPSIRVLAIRYDPYFDRPGLYQDAQGDYPDNLERFTLFSRAVLQSIRILNAGPGGGVDILHLHDWQTALCAVYLKAVVLERKGLERLKTLLTLHNVGYQGIFPGGRFVNTGLPSTLFAPNGLEFFGSVNFLKGGIVFADAVSTVSSTYANEIRTKEFGFGLEGVLAGRTEGIPGIINGIDTTVWNPETDPHLSARFHAGDLSGKRACKRALQQELGLPTDDIPLLAVIGRLTSQKGFDLLIEIIPELMTMDVQVVVLGVGDRNLEEQLLAAKSRYPERISVSVGFDEGLAHRIEAGADMLAMPSRYEPCGLSQLYSLRYGTVPIVRKTGGLADTVIPYKPSTVRDKFATGFHFMDASPEALLSTIVLASKIYGEPEVWRSLQQAGMKTDVSWGRTTNQYEQLYRSVIGREEQTTGTR